jgi:hypothetical protein
MEHPMTTADEYLAMQYDEHRDRSFREHFTPLTFLQYLTLLRHIVRTA